MNIEKLLKSVEIENDNTILILNSGDGELCFNFFELNSTSSILGIEENKELVSLAKSKLNNTNKQKIRFRVGSIENLPVTANKADVVISNYAISQNSDHYMSLNEIIRITKPSGTIILNEVTLNIPFVTEKEIRPQFQELLSIIEKTGFLNTQVLEKKEINNEKNTYETIIVAQKPNCSCAK